MSVSVEDAVIARIEKGGEKFEVLVDPELALELRHGKEIDMEDVLSAYYIFSDAKKGLKVPEADLNKKFGTNNIEEIAKKIIIHGQLQLTTEQRRQMLEAKKKEIIAIIAKEGINPQTRLPHPMERIENAIEEAKVQINPNKKASEQIDYVVESIQRIIPIKLEKMEIEVTIPASHAGKAANVMHTLGTIKKEEWLGDGTYKCVIQIPAGMQTEIYDKINNFTHGENEIKVIKEEKYR